MVLIEGFGELLLEEEEGDPGRNRGLCCLCFFDDRQHHIGNMEMHLRASASALLW